MLPTIQKGNNNSYVKIAKYLMGYSAAGKATSTYDSKFVTFVKNWQRTHSLKDTGIVDATTWEMIAQTAPMPSSICKTANYAFQLAYGLAVNGRYNDATKNAITLLQKASGLPVDGKCGPATWKELIARVAVPAKHTIDFKQNDPKWAKLPYTITNSKSQTIESSGCGPTTAADIVYALKDKTVTPVSLCEFAIACGARKKTGGTDKILFQHLKNKWGFSRVIETKSLTIVRHCLDKGGYVAVDVSKGYFTSGGHWMCIWKIDNKTVYLDNPISKIKVKREISKFTPEVQHYMCVYP